MSIEKQNSTPRPPNLAASNEQLTSAYETLHLSDDATPVEVRARLKEIQSRFLEDPSPSPDKIAKYKEYETAYSRIKESKQGFQEALLEERQRASATEFDVGAIRAKIDRQKDEMAAKEKRGEILERLHTNKPESSNEIIIVSREGGSYLARPDRPQEKLSRNFKSIEKHGKLFIAYDGHTTQLLDPESGRIVARDYRSIKPIGSLLVGEKGLFSNFLLDPETGEVLSKAYLGNPGKKLPAFEQRGSVLVGINTTNETLLDPKTGKELSKPFDRIEVRNGKVFGIKKEFMSTKENEEELA